MCCLWFILGVPGLRLSHIAPPVFTYSPDAFFLFPGGFWYQTEASPHLCIQVHAAHVKTAHTNICFDFPKKWKSCIVFLKFLTCYPGVAKHVSMYAASGVGHLTTSNSTTKQVFTSRDKLVLQGEWMLCITYGHRCELRTDEKPHKFERKETCVNHHRASVWRLFLALR